MSENLKRRPFMFFGGIGHHVFYVRKKGDLYASGRNLEGQLSLGDTTNRNTPTLVPHFKGRSKREISSVSCGSCHSLLLTVGDGVLSCGHGAYGQLSTGNTSIYQLLAVPISLDGRANIIGVFAGQYETYLLTEDGEVLSSGLNTRGQLGLGDKTQRNKAEKIKNLKDIVDIVTGNCWVIFQSKDRLFSCGYNGKGQLSIGNNTDQALPVEITCFRDKNIKIKSILSSMNASFYHTESGQMYVCGCNCKGEHGIGNTTNCSLPVISNGFNGIQLSWHGVGNHFEVFKKNGNNLYGNSNSSFGYCGLGGQGNVTTPMEIQNMRGKDVVQIVHGLDFTFLICSNGDVYFAGYGGKGVAMNGTNNTSKTFILVQKGLDLKEMHGNNIVIGGTPLDLGVMKSVKKEIDRYSEFLSETMGICEAVSSQKRLGEEEKVIMENLTKFSPDPTMDVKKSLLGWRGTLETVKKEKLMGSYDDFLDLKDNATIYENSKFEEMEEYSKSSKKIHSMLVKHQDAKEKLEVIEKLFMFKLNLGTLPIDNPDEFEKVVADMEKLTVSLKVVMDFTQQLLKRIKEFDFENVKELEPMTSLREKEIQKSEVIIQNSKIPSRMKLFENILTKEKELLNGINVGKHLKRIEVQQSTLITVCKRAPGLVYPLDPPEGKMILSCMWRSDLKKAVFKIGESVMKGREEPSNEMLDFLEVIEFDSYHQKLVEFGLEKIDHLRILSDQDLLGIFGIQFKVTIFKRYLEKLKSVEESIDCLSIKVDKVKSGVEVIEFELVPFVISNTKLFSMIRKKLGLSEGMKLRLKLKGSVCVDSDGDESIKTVLLRQILMKQTRESLKSVKCILFEKKD